MPIDYAKFDKIVAEQSDDEDYDDYLRRSYGVKSDWRPGCGMQKPVLGGRTPGQTYEESELTPLGEFDMDSLAEDLPATPIEAATPSGGEWGSCAKCFCGIIRSSEIVAWVLPLVMAGILLGFEDSSELRFEATIYPGVVTTTVAMGLLDACVAALANTNAEGPASVAFACWFKRSFLAMSFLAYEAQYTSLDGDLGGVSVRPASALLMILVWSVRKVIGYGNDLVALVRSQPQHTTVVPGGRAILALEALTEFAFLTVHLAFLPSGTRIFGYKQPTVIWASSISVALLGDLFALSRATRPRQDIAKEHAS